MKPNPTRPASWCEALSYQHTPLPRSKGYIQTFSRYPGRCVPIVYLTIAPKRRAVVDIKEPLHEILTFKQ